jgi:hypothetical protein
MRDLLHTQAAWVKRRAVEGSPMRRAAEENCKQIDSQKQYIITCRSSQVAAACATTA